MATRGDFAPIVASYALCIVPAVAVIAGFDLPQPWNAFAADVVATVVIFAFSRAYSNSSFYDPYWSVIPPLLAVYWMWVHGAGHDIRAWLVQALVWFWAIRLTTNWSIHWGGLEHEDWRYPLVRARACLAAVLVDFLGIHLFPTVQVFLGCLPIYFVMSRSYTSLSGLDVLAFVVTLGAILIEMIADLQLHAYIRQKREPGGFITTGLWAWSRHPNYFGEVSFWWGLAMFGISAAPAQWIWIMPGAIAMTLMFVFASIPLMDQRSVERRPAYAEHMRRVSALLPLPPRR